MSNTYHLSMPYIQGGQAQKHVTHNEALRTLDTLVHLSVVRQATSPDVGAQDGDRYIVVAGASGDFAGQDGKVALREAGTWLFLAPQVGWTAFDQSTGGQIVFDGSDWTAVMGGNNVTSTDRLGINATADTTNKLAVGADATLLSHNGAGHQLKLNKAANTDTASLLFQTGFSGRAEMGLTGSDNFEVKVSADGASFYTVLQADGASGAVSFPNTSLAPSEFGASDLTTTDYITARGAGIVSNGSGALGNAYNYPSSFAFDASQTPNLPGAIAKSGHNSSFEEATEFLAIDPNRLYRLGAYLRQESVAGDWSAFANGDRHEQYMGFRCYDIDGNAINSSHHARYQHGGVDSLTTLTQPLAPGDTVVHVADATGWNESSSSIHERGIVIFGYRNTHGQTYDYYSRIEDSDLFELSGVDKTNNQITLSQPLPSYMGNPDDAGGVWPVGTRLANRDTGWNYKFSFFRDLIPDAADTWYRVENFMGGIDQSGRNLPGNFAPGTAWVRLVWLLNYSNRVGGWSVYPDTGASQRVWFSGVSVEPEITGQVVRDADGSCDLFVVQGDAQAGTASFGPAAQSVTPL